MNKKITIRTVKELLLSQQKYLWDTELKGFFARQLKTGIFYGVYYRNAQGRQRRFSLGQHGHLTPTQARTEAKKLLGEVAKGKDPAAERQRQKRGFTVAQLVDQFMSDHVVIYNKPRTQKETHRIFQKHVVPAIGKLRVDSVRKGDIVKLHASLKKTPILANRVLARLTTLFHWAQAQGYLDGKNPTRGVKKFPEGKRERFLSPRELAQLGVALSAAEKEGEDPYAVGAIRLLIFTGMRRGEVLGLKWDWIDFERKEIRLPDSKTGPKTVPLNLYALQHLEKMKNYRMAANNFVFVGRLPGSHLFDLKKPWAKVCKKAGIKNLRIHDLRHNFVSVGANIGQPLGVMAALIGHAQASMTQRYSHLSDDAARAANEQIGQAIYETMQGEVKNG